LRFRSFFALLLIALFGYMLFQAFLITPENGELTINNFGEADIENRTAAKYINKNVNSAGSTSESEVVFQKSRNLESGSANIVTSVVANYRSLDTLGEVTVLFLAAAGIGVVLKLSKEKSENSESSLNLIKSRFASEKSSLILKTGIKLLFPLLILAGTYIFIHGHLTPGGGFQGGAVIATAFLLKLITDEEFELNEIKLSALESTAGVLFVGLGLYGLAVKGSFLYNFMSTGTVGRLFSSGIIPIIYLVVALKVGSELSSIVKNLIEA